MPPVVWASNDTTITNWEWRTSLGLMGTGDTLKGANLIEGLTYTLTGIKNPIIPGAKRCSSTYQFVWSRDSFPPQDQHFVAFMDGRTIQLCISDGDTGKIVVWEDGVRQKYSPMNIQWYKGTEEVPGQGYSLIVEDTGMYMVHIQDSLGCWGRDTAWVTMDERLGGPVLPCIVTGPTGTFTFIWPAGTPVVENHVSIDGGLTWLPASEGYQHKVHNIQSQKFIMGRGRVNSACEWTDISTSLECPDQVYPPNVMTPNGDGLNDIFLIKGLELFDESKVQIFDRWGNVVFSSDDYENTWDGGELPEGTYYYILEVNDPQSTVHKGILTILR
jgi:gliding motility-associated-like protein